MCPQELQGFLTSITQTYKFNYLPGPLVPMGKPCVFLSEHQGHRRQCRMPPEYTGRRVLPQLPHKPQQVQGGTRSWEVWGGLHHCLG